MNKERLLDEILVTGMPTRWAKVGKSYILQENFFESIYDIGKDSNVVNPLLDEMIDDWISDLETEDIYILPELLEKMKKFRVKHFV